MAFSWEEANAFALTLPGVALSPYYGIPSPKVRGKAFVYRSHEPGSFGIAVPLDEIGMLKEPIPRPSGNRRTTRAGPRCSCARRRRTIASASWR